MRILFIVQGEGRGHLTQAMTMEAMLRRNGHEVVEVLVGKSGARSLPDFFSRSMDTPIRLFDSPNFLPTPSNKRSNLTRSVAYNIFKTPTYMKSILFIRSRIIQTKADLVVNFYELLTGLTYLLFRPQVPQVSIGHQYLFLHSGFEFPKGSPVSLFFLRMVHAHHVYRRAGQARPVVQKHGGRQPERRERGAAAAPPRGARHPTV